MLEEKGSYLWGIRKMKYEEVAYLELEEVNRLLASSNDKSKIKALLVLSFYEYDYDFAISQVLNYCRSKKSEVKAIAILCIGHMARTYKKLNDVPVIDVIVDALSDESEIVKSNAVNVLDDLSIYLPELYKKAKKKIG